MKSQRICNRTNININYDLHLQGKKEKYFLLPASEYPYEERESSCAYSDIKYVIIPLYTIELNNLLFSTVLSLI